MTLSSSKQNSNENYADDMRFRALKICRDHLGGAWKKVSASEMSLIPISGGMSNTLYCCSLPNFLIKDHDNKSSSSASSSVEPSQVLLRFYGDTTKNSDEISIQLDIFKLLSNKNLGPKLYGKFDDGRLEEFLPAKSLTSEELMDSKISSVIAKKLSQIHRLDVPRIDKNCIWLEENFKKWFQFISLNLEKVSLSYNTNNHNGAENNNNNNHHLTRQNNNNNKGHNQRQLSKSTIDIARQLLSIDFKEEINFLIGILNKTQSPIVFSHNDLHQGNILLAKHSETRPTLNERIVFIDFEYCSYNYRAYDIANHLSEWCFQYDTPDYPHFQLFQDRFPSKQVQIEFVKNYLKQASNKSPTIQQMATRSTSLNGSSIMNRNQPNGGANIRRNSNNHRHQVLRSDDNNNNNDTNDDADDKHFSINGDSNHHNNRKKLNGHYDAIQQHSNGNFKSLDAKALSLYEEIQPFFMMANFLWTLWCIKSAQSSNIKFGYWEHAMARWQIYNKFKAAYLKSLRTIDDLATVNDEDSML